MKSQYKLGSVTRLRNKYWRGQWWVDGKHRSRVLGLISQMSKTEARLKLREILDELNRRSAEATQTLSYFTEHTFFPVYERRWKSSTAGTTKDRIKFHILKDLGAVPMCDMTRNRMQDFLDAKAGSGLSQSVVAHLRWDLSNIISLAADDGIVPVDTSRRLNIPKAKQAGRKVLGMRELALALSALDVHDLLVVRLATLCGMRPGEIFGLQWKHYKETHVEIEQRVYRGVLDSPKTFRSRRQAALSKSTRDAFDLWRSKRAARPEDWVFLSENPDKPEQPSNVMRRKIRPALKKVGLGWVSFQVMRRTHASLMKELNQDMKATSDQLGHSLDVDLNVYTQTSVEYRSVALEELEAAIGREESRQ